MATFPPGEYNQSYEAPPRIDADTRGRDRRMRYTAAFSREHIGAEFDAVSRGTASEFRMVPDAAARPSREHRHARAIGRLAIDRVFRSFLAMRCGPRARIIRVRFGCRPR